MDAPELSAVAIRIAIRGHPCGEVLRSSNGIGQTNAEYHPTLFAEQPAYELRPQHNGVIGQIR